MAQLRVRVWVVDPETDERKECPLDDAPPLFIRFASVVHGRDLSDADLRAIIEGPFRGIV